MQNEKRHSASKWNDLDSFRTVTSQTKDIYDEVQELRKENFNLQLRLYCKNEAKQQQHREQQVSESPGVISSLRKELKLKTKLLMRATSATDECKECIAKNEVKIAELESQIAKLEYTADDLTAAKTQIKVLGMELSDRDETVFSCEAKIRELAVQNSNLIDLIDSLRSNKNNQKAKNQIRNCGAKKNHKSRFSIVTRLNRHVENMFLNHCNGKDKDQFIEDLCAAHVKKLNVTIATLRKELKIKTNLLVQTAFIATEHKACIARNEMKIAELQSYAEKHDSTADELKEAKRQIEVLGKELEKRDETVNSCESKIKELALKNSKLISRTHTYNNNFKAKESLITQKKLLHFNTAQKHHITKVFTDVNYTLGYQNNLVVNSKVSVKVLGHEGISYHEAMVRHRCKRNEHLVRSLTKENKNYKSNIEKLECSNYVLGNFRFNFWMEAILKGLMKSFLYPYGDSCSNSKGLLLSSSFVPSVDNDLLVSSSGFNTNEGIWSALRSAFLRVRDRISKAMI